MQALAAAQLAARKAANATAETSGTNRGPDPRLQPPERAERSVQFKPGTSTWNTDDPSQVLLATAADHASPGCSLRNALRGACNSSQAPQFGTQTTPTKCCLQPPYTMLQQAAECVGQSV